MPRKKHTMPCLSCGAPTEARDTRAYTVDGYAATKRRRVCPACGERFFSYEIPRQMLRRESILGPNRDELFAAIGAVEVALSKIRASQQ